ncbi:efflux RND transporter periplasmic adaptor subunit [Flavihumibacter cheonanensis]|uniref:efflux RND transporter periplasmic adaptor subunit n=1 Tax=Flavihumibacter TaxID=1004301 RepID=UPI001EF7F40F|nr:MULTISPECIES: efflux RND transporter periplasmic adaptor subunit [Flavihumibacter]MCG7752162.1 efflux RND transporter periplasmic adaptor subunit [Flavihumibacter cheonanensis]
MNTVNKIKDIVIMSVTIIVMLISAFTMVSCNSSGKQEVEISDSTAANKKKISDKAEEEHSEAIELTTEQMKAVGIEIGKVELKNLSSVIKASGQLEVPPQNKADVTSLIGGVIKRIFVLEGNYVKKGQTLAMIENPEFIKLQQEYLSIKKGHTYTMQEFERQKELKENNAGTGKIYQQAESNLLAEQARLTGLEAQMKQFGINPASIANGNIVTQLPIRAPIGGVIGHININVGSYVDVTKSLMDIIDNSNIHCDLLVFEKDLFKVKVGQEVNFILTNQDNRQITGRVYGINQSFESENKAVIVHAVIKDGAKYKLIPGMYVSALIKVGNESVTAVPVDAVVKSEGKEYVFIVDEELQESVKDKDQEEKEEKTDKKEESKGDENKLAFKMVEVITGVAELGYIQITFADKAPENARVVTKGAFYILSKTKGGEEEE